MGWASRKKKPLWLLLKGDTLYTFLREQVSSRAHIRTFIHV